MSKLSARWNSAPGTMAVRIAGMGVNFLVLALVARWAGQDNLGIVIALNGAAFVGGTVCSLGLPTLLLKTMTGDLMTGDVSAAAGEYHRAVRMTFRVAAGLLAVLLVGAAAQWVGWLPRAFGSLGPLELVAMGFCSLGMGLQALGLSSIRALKQPALSGVFQFCSQPLLLLIGMGLLHLSVASITPVQAVGALVASMLLNALLLHFLVQKKLPRGGQVVLPPIPWGETRSLWLLGTMSAASANIPLLLAAVLLTPASVALLGVPFRICNLPMTVVAALGAYYAPLIREAHLQGNLVQQRKHLVDSQWIGAALVMPVLGLAIFAPGFVLQWFTLHDPVADRLFLLFACAQTLIAACGVSEQYLAMLDRARIAARLTQWSLFGMIATCLLLPRPVSPLALALTWAAFAVFRQVSLWWVGLRHDTIAAKKI